MAFHLEEKLMKECPHLAECGNEIINAKTFCRTLKDDFPQKKYQRRQGCLKTIMHWGQRKLFICELEFLTKYYERFQEIGGKDVLYIGAASGIHIPYLVKLFPNLHWILYDPSPFDKNLYKYSEVEIHNDFFTENDISLYKTKKTLLISDIRDPELSKMEEEEEQNTAIMDDMTLQRKIYEEVKPFRALLKFRLSWTPGITNYLDGQLFIQPWAGNHSTETRLVPNGKYKDYDNTKYEEQMYYHNTVTRKMSYPKKSDCYCNCYDCYAEYRIIESYYKDIKKYDLLEISPSFIELITQEVTNLIAHRTISLLDYSREYITKYNLKLLQVSQK